MISKKINLFLISVLCIVVVYSVPFYNNWLYEKVITDNNNMLDQIDRQGYEERMLFRFGASYSVYQGIVKMVKSSPGPRPIILIPTNSYIHSKHITQDFNMVEPAVFYYFTGLKGVMANSPGVDSANWALVVEDRTMAIRTIKDKEDFRTLVTEYAKYQ